MSYSFKEKLKRASKKSPKYILKRGLKELMQPLNKKKELARSELDLATLLQACKADSLNTLWQQLSQAPFPFQGKSTQIDSALQQRIDMAMNHQVDLLGSGVIDLGQDIQWNKDYPSGKVWPNQFCHQIQINDLSNPSDVKFPWEVSRFQWLLPLAQAYRINQNKQHAEKTKTLILDWIAKNPYAMSVNWSCTMDVAIRAINWIYLFYSFNQAKSWQEPSFQETFLKSLFCHGRFCEHNIEMHEPNTNHYLSDAAGLVFIGQFFANSDKGQAWTKMGQDMLETEIGKQISKDGACFEGSIAYHRLSSELFFYCYLYNSAKGTPSSEHYQKQLYKMAQFIDAYTNPNGETSVVGDADNGRILPFEIKPINNHYYLVHAIAHALKAPELINKTQAKSTELNWIFNESVSTQSTGNINSCTSFKPGYCILQNSDDHIFIDCAEVGMNGRGGHGHNDCLSFCATLNNEAIIVDRGCYLYTKNPEARNEFRATSSHNTIELDDREINDLVDANMLWDLNYQAKPQINQCHTLNDRLVFNGSHTGYNKLNDNVQIQREISLLLNHCLYISDHFSADNAHKVTIPYYFAANVCLEKQGEKRFLIKTPTQQFMLAVESEEPWQCRLQKTTLAPSYGQLVDSTKLVFEFKGHKAELKIAIAPL